MTWRVALIDSCGSLPSGVNAAVIDAAAFVTDGRRVECRAAAADPTGHGSRIADVLMGAQPRERSVELLLGQVFFSDAPASSAAVAAAIDWAVARSAGLIHLSLGLSADRAVLATAVRRAIAAGCILVAAMPARGGLVYPAAYPGVIRATGDARCAPGEWSCLGPWFFGGCPRAEGYAGGGASIGAAWITHAILREPTPAASPATSLSGSMAGSDAVDASSAVAALTSQATYRGPERRTTIQNL